MNSLRLAVGTKPACLLTLLLTAITGCSSLKMPDAGKMFGKKDPPKATTANPVERVVAIWQSAEGRGLNGVPTRGFAGQILFIPRTGGAPVIVDGDVRIYVFDDQGTAEEQSKPIHQFDFTNGGWDAQLTSGTLGPSYQVFVPYTRSGGHRTRCALRVRFAPKNGAPIYSEMVNVTLDGPAADDDDFTPISKKTESRTAESRTRTVTFDPGAAAKSSRSRVSNIVPAGHSTPAGGESPEAARIAQLEAMVSELMQHESPASHRAAPARPPVRRPPATQHPVAEPRAAPPNVFVEDHTAQPAPVRTGHPLGGGFDAHPLSGQSAQTVRETRSDWESEPQPPTKRYRLSRVEPSREVDTFAEPSRNESFTHTPTADTIEWEPADVPDPTDDDIFTQFEVVN